MKQLSAALAAGLLLALAGCTVPATEVIVITDTDLAVPSELDELRVEVTGPRGDVMSASAFLEVPGAIPPPRALSLVHDGGPLGPFRVHVAGRLNDTEVVVRTAVFEFVENETRVLRLDLLQECVGTSCSAGNTCAAGGCRAEEVAESELERFDGEIPTGDAGPGQDAGPPVDGGPPPDGGPGDAGDCTPTDEVCNEADDDCDTMVDEGFDLMTDTANCGRCGNACPSGESCVDGTCSGGCPTGFADCDGDTGNGCETMLGTTDDCGSCGDRCPGSRMCCSGMCMMVASCP